MVCKCSRHVKSTSNTALQSGLLKDYADPIPDAIDAMADLLSQPRSKIPTSVLSDTRSTQHARGVRGQGQGEAAAQKWRLTENRPIVTSLLYLVVGSGVGWISGWVSGCLLSATLGKRKSDGSVNESGD